MKGGLACLAGCSLSKSKRAGAEREKRAKHEASDLVGDKEVVEGSVVASWKDLPDCEDVMRTIDWAWWCAMLSMEHLEFMMVLMVE